MRSELPPPGSRLSAPTRRAGATARPWLFALCLVSALLLLRGPTPTPAVIVAATTALLAATVGELRTIFFCFGLTTTVGASLKWGVPLGLFVPTAALVGTLLRSMATRRPATRDGLLVVLTLVVGFYGYLSPPLTNAGFVSAYALALLPLSIFVLRSTVLHAVSVVHATGAFAIGAATSVGLGLGQAYAAVGSSYSTYQDARVFESSIGSSNFAAGLAAVVGVLIFALAWESRGSRRLALLALAAVFLAAPVIFASRGAVGAVVVGVIAVGAGNSLSRLGTSNQQSKSRIPRLAAACLGVFALGILASQQEWYVWERFMDQAQSGAGFSAGRTELWTHALQQAWVHPLAGVGPGGLTDDLLAKYGFAYSHNFILDVSAQLGVVGGGIYLWLTRPAPLAKWSIVTPALLTGVAHSLVEPNLSTTPGMALFAGLVACHHAVHLDGRETSDSHSQSVSATA